LNRRPNRIVLLLTGLVLMAAGAVALLAADGILPLPGPAELSEQLAVSAADRPQEWAAGGVIGGLVVAAVGMWLVRRQLRVRRGAGLGTVTLHHHERGRTTVESVAVARAAEADLRARRGVVDSDVRMITLGARPRFLVSLAIGADIEPRAALERAEEAYERVRKVLGRDAVHVDTTVRPTGQPPGRVD